MAKSIEISAKTIDLAIEKGLLELGREREDVTVEVLENPKQGFLGIGAAPAKILMTVLSEDGKEEKKPAKKAERPVRKAEKKEQAPKDRKKTVPADGFAAEFLTEVISHIAEGASIQKVEDNEAGTLNLEIVGENLGGIIGRRGETLDALQHLVNLAAARRDGEKVRIMLDAEDYRAKRKESLDKFARRAAAQVIKYKRNRVLEPMNAYERHIVHVALQDMENISTSSVGTDPNRRVVINYTGPDARPSRRNYHR